MGRRINPSGLVIAGIGFFATRFTVELALYETDPVRFYIAGVLPLTVGLGLAVFGVAIAIADVDKAVSRTTAMWCVIGAISMLVFGVLTVYGTVGVGMAIEGRLFRSSLSNFVIGGSVGGTLTGIYAARSRANRRRLRQHTNRLVVLNRLLRHEVLNAITAIRGYATLGSSYADEAEAVVMDRSAAIERTIKKVKDLTHRADEGSEGTVRVDVGDCLERAVETVSDQHPDVRISIVGDPSGLEVWADGQLESVIAELLDNAIVHGQDDEPTVTVAATASTVRIGIRDDGPGLPDRQRRLLKSGDIGEFDDPTTGFGLNLVRFYVTEFAGELDITADDVGSEVAVTLSRARPASERPGPNALDLTGVRPALPHLLVAIMASLAAGVAYGIVSEQLGGSIAGIGVFYGTVDPVVGWLTHEFHSIVFGLVYIGLLALLPEDWPDGYLTYLGIGIGWSLVVWLGAASLIAPIWLQLSGIPVDIPTFSTRLLVSHVGWGLTLALVTAVGYRRLLPDLLTALETRRP